MESVANDSEFKSMVDDYNIHCLLTDDSSKFKIRGFESLVNGGTYTLATIRILVEGVGGVKLSSDAELDKLLGKQGVACLLDNDGDQVVGFQTLAPGGTYTLGPQVKKQKQEDSEEEEQRKAKADEAYEYILKQKQDSETLLISQPETRKYTATMNRFGVPKDAPSWNNKPTLTETTSFLDDCTRNTICLQK